MIENANVGPKAMIAPRTCRNRMKGKNWLRSMRSPRRGRPGSRRVAEDRRTAWPARDGFGATLAFERRVHPECSFRRPRELSAQGQAMLPRLWLSLAQGT